MITPEATGGEQESMCEYVSEHVHALYDFYLITISCTIEMDAALAVLCGADP